MVRCHLFDSQCFQPGFRAKGRFHADEIYSSNIKIDQMVITPSSDPWVFLTCPRNELDPNGEALEGHHDTIVISVDGACWNNGLPNAEAAAGVYVGENSRFNKSFRINGEQTSQKAELKAAIAGVEQALLIRQSGIDIVAIDRNNMGRNNRLISVPLRMVVIKADSEYVVKGITEWILQWKQNGYKDARGHPVANAVLFQQLDTLVTRLEGVDVKVMFWHVLRAHNTKADSLANQAITNSREREWWDDYDEDDYLIGI